MNGFLQRMLAYRSDSDLLEIALGYKRACDDLRDQIQGMQLETARIQRDWLAAFLVALDKPEEEDELRATLHEALRDMADEVARLEEHVK